jgi:dolichyl-phosphate-mannose-protein mannosyltransferase
LQTTTDLSTSVETSPTNLPQAAKRRVAVGSDVLAMLLVILLIAGIRWRLRDFPLERDEGEYAYAGQSILEGIPPYKFAYNMKLPGTYAAYAVIMAVFGQTPAGIHLGLIVVNAASIVLLFLIVSKLFDPLAAVVASATFGLFTIRPLLLGLAAHATHFVTLFALLSVYLLLTKDRKKQLAAVFLSGLCGGLAFLMKQPGIFFAVFGGIYLCLSARHAGESAGPIAKKVAIYTSGVMLPYALTCLVLFRAGVFHKFWFWTVQYARAYGSELSAREGLRQFANRMELQKEYIGAIWFLMVLGLAALLWNRKWLAHAEIVLSLLGCSFLAISVGLYYRGHYFIMAYPILAMLAGMGASASKTILGRLVKPQVATWMTAGLVTMTFANALYAERKTYFVDSPHDACRYVYGKNPFPEAIEIGNYIQATSKKNERVAVFGSEPEIYFYAHRLSATGYIYTYALVEEQQYGSVMQDEMIREIEATRPEIIVYVLMRESWNTREHADLHVFDWMDQYLKNHYSLTGVADGGNRDIYRWGDEATNYRPRRNELVAVYRRNL